MWQQCRALILASSVLFGIGCAAGSRPVIPSCPQPTAAQANAVQAAADMLPELARLEQRRIVHCCRLEVVKQSDRKKLCIGLIEELGTDGD